MAKEPFLLVSLEESESKNLAQVMSNDTARKILDFLSKEDKVSETDVSKKLKIALSTVHYNLQALVKANLVVAEEFHYSEKGKEVLHYSLANKLIIIAPKKVNSESFKDKLRSLLPVAAISIGVAGLIRVFGGFMRAGASVSSDELGAVASFYAPAAAPIAAEGARAAVQEVVQDAAPQAAPLAMKMTVDAVANGTAELAAEAASFAATAPPEAVSETAGVAADAAVQAVPITIKVVESFSPDQLALWFLAGSMFAILVMVVWYYFSSRKK